MQLVNSEFRAKEKVNTVVLSRSTNKYSWNYNKEAFGQLLKYTTHSYSYL